MICELCQNEHNGSYGSGRFCSKECARSFSTKAKRKEINEKVSKTLTGRISPKRGKDFSLEKRYCPICNKELSEYSLKHKHKTCSYECGRKLSVLKLKEKGIYTKNAGFKPGSVRSRWGYYKDIYCASTYELVYLIYSLEHNIPIERNKDYFNYKINNVSKRYLPDFKINETYIEIKNFPRKEVDIKAEAVIKQGKEIKILYYKDLEEMMNYIDSKYNTWHTKRDNNYHTLYDIRT